MPARLRAWWEGLDDARRRRLKGLLFFELAVIAAFIKTLISLFTYTLDTELHSHVVLIPVVSAWLLSIHKDRLPAHYHTSAGWGTAFLLAGGVILGLTGWLPAAQALSPHDRFAPLVLSLVCFIVSGAFFFLGRRWMRQAVFPAFFLLFMIPLPGGVVHAMELASQRGSAEATNWLLHLSGVTWLRAPDDPMVFHFPGIALRVAEECSGIRSSWVLLITGVVAANLFLKSPWRRLLFVAFVIPLGILRNGFRIVTLGWLCVNVGPEMIDHWIHHRGGPVFFGLSLIPLFLFLLLLRRGERRAERRRDAGGKEVKPEPLAEPA